jgi:hypothetical protein
MVKIDNCIEKICQETENFVSNEKDNFVRWLDKNICYKQDSILNLKDACEMYLGKIVPSRISSKYRKEIEEWIKQKFKNVNHIYQDTTFNSQKYKGWLHLSFVE